MANTVQVHKEGWLAKTGSNNSGWRDRYFILSNGRLSYFKSNKDTDPQGFIDLKEVTQVVSTQGKKGYGFDLLVPGRVYNMSAKSSVEEDDWITAIKQSLEIVRKIYGPPPVADTSVTSRKATASFSGGFLGRKKATVRSESSHSAITAMDEDDSDSLTRSTSPSHSNPKSDVEINSLLDAQVDLLKRKVSELEKDLEASKSQRKDLQHKMEENKTGHDVIVKQLNSEINTLKAKINSLENSKLKLETVNDSLSAQIQDKDDNISSLQQTIEELKDIEEESKQYQEEAALTKERLDEVEEVFEALQNKMKSDEASFKIEKQKQSEQLEQLREKLELTEKERDRFKAAISLRQRSETAATVDESELMEEKLKLQLELENLKVSMNEQIQEKKSAYDKDKQSLNSQLEAAEQECNQLRENLESVTNQLSDANRTINGLKEAARASEEKRNQLQIEKEKVMGDLITLRKSMKEKERTLPDDEHPPSSSGRKNEGSPTVTAKLADAESRAEMATKLLQEIQSERDSLKEQLSRKYSPSPSPTHTNVNGAFPPPPLFLMKSQPTITLSSPDVPPPKPKRPPKELLDKLKI